MKTLGLVSPSDSVKSDKSEFESGRSRMIKRVVKSVRAESFCGLCQTIVKRSAVAAKFSGRAEYSVEHFTSNSRDEK